MKKDLKDTDPFHPVTRMLYIFRWTIIALVLVAVRFIHFSSAYVQRDFITYAIAAMAAATVLFQVLAKNRPALRKPIFSVIVDILLVTIIVYFSDGIQSPFFALYYVTVISAAASFGISAALWSAFAIALISFGIEVAEAGGSITEVLILRDIVRTVPYLFLIAAIAGILRERIRILAARTAALGAERSVWEREMELASSVQRAQLPLSLPDVPGVEIAVCYKPAREVGGDLYDFYPVADDRIGIIVADVAGKGVPAALMVSTAKYAVREHYSENIPHMMWGVNEHIASAIVDDAFVTMVYGSLDIAARRFKYVNAGHMPPIVIKAVGGEITSYPGADVPLGISASVDYCEQVIDLETGDILVLYTDGVTDALASSEDGFEEFQAFIADMLGRDISTWGGELMHRIAEPRHLDDVTMVILRII